MAKDSDEQRIMALNTHKDVKRYYSISEVAEMFQVAESLLRYWEKEFPTINPKKNARGVRMYTADDLEEIRLIHNLVKVRGMKLSAARETIRRSKSETTTTADLIERLQEIRAELVAIRKELTEVNAF